MLKALVRRAPPVAILRMESVLWLRGDEFPRQSPPSREQSSCTRHPPQNRCIPRCALRGIPDRETCAQPARRLVSLLPETHVCEEGLKIPFQHIRLVIKIAERNIILSGYNDDCFEWVRLYDALLWTRLRSLLTSHTIVHVDRKRYKKNVSCQIFNLKKVCVGAVPCARLPDWLIDPDGIGGRPQGITPTKKCEMRE